MPVTMYIIYIIKQLTFLHSSHLKYLPDDRNTMHAHIVLCSVHYWAGNGYTDTVNKGRFNVNKLLKRGPR